MSVFIRPMPLCALILLAALPAGAGQSTVSPASAVLAPSVTQDQPVTQGAAPVDRQSYARRAEGELQEWATKLHAFGERAKAKGQAAGTATDDKLQAAWGNLRTATRDLQAAGADTWDGARHAYEQAANELAAAWQVAERHL